LAPSPAAAAFVASDGVSWKYVVMNTALSVFVMTSAKVRSNAQSLSSYLHVALKL
jgi:hypothetical protein